MAIHNCQKIAPKCFYVSLFPPAGRAETMTTETSWNFQFSVITAALCFAPISRHSSVSSGAVCV